jgi:predicted ATPase/transcriptional regulator with XRE-family HTH domain
MNGTTSFGEWLKQRRKALDLTQQELGRCAGCSLATVLKLEADERRPSRQLAELLLRCLEVPHDEVPTLMRLARVKSDTNGHAEPDLAPTPMPTRNVTKTAPLAIQNPKSPNNLPAQLTRLIGREQAVEEISDYLLNDGIRLLTLTGPPGIGKTRLGLQVATQMLDYFRDGVFFVALASLREPDLVASTIVQTLGGKDEADQSPSARLARMLQDKQILLLLDNFEQFLGPELRKQEAPNSSAAAPLVVRLLEECPRLKVLVTSREVLHVRGEQQYTVSPLALPDSGVLPSVETFSHYPAIALFVDRARTVNPEFALTEENAKVVAAICARLDGLPLAIELVAARSKMLSPSALLARLTAGSGTLTSLRLLTGGAHDLPIRHQTLRAAIDWSYDLLDKEEKLLFTRLGVFTGGFTLTAVEAICNAHGELGEDVVDVVDSLLNKSLVRVGEQGEGEVEPRFSMLETIHEYALERLTGGGELEQLQGLHVKYYLDLAEAAAAHLAGPEQTLWLNRLDCDYDNLRAAISQALLRGDAEIAARLGGALLRYWMARSHFSEGRKWIERVLAQRENIPPLPLAKLLNGAAILASIQGDHEHASWLNEQGLEMYRASGDKSGIANSLNNLGILARHNGEFEQALLFFEESLTLCKELQDENRVAMLLGNLGVTTLDKGDIGRAELLLKESLALCRELGNKRGMVTALGKLAEVAQHRRDYEHMRSLYVEFVALLDEIGDNLSIINVIKGCAAAELAEGRPEYAASLLGAVEALIAASDAPMQPVDQVRFNSMVDDVRSQLDAAHFAETWSRGQEMSANQAMALALGSTASQ